MNSLGHFWNEDHLLGLSLEEVLALGRDDRTDLFEGAVAACDVRELPFPDDMKKHISLPVLIRADAFQYCNLLCFVGHHYDPQTQVVQTLDSRMRDFGEYAVRIRDVDEFFNRVCERARRQGDICTAAPVEYRPRWSKREQMDCFDKLDRFAYQREWRIACLHKPERLKHIARKREREIRLNPECAGGITGFYDEAYILHVRDLSDIADIVAADVLMNDIAAAYPGYMPIPMIQPDVAYRGFYAGYSREMLMAKVMELGGGVRPIFAMGG